jgi:hypothetical protein
VAGSVMGPGALFSWLQRENTLFHVRVNAAVEALPAVIVVFFIIGTPMTSDNKVTLTFCDLSGMFFVENLRESLISVKRRDWELCRLLQTFIPVSLIRV